MLLACCGMVAYFAAAITFSIAGKIEQKGILFAGLAVSFWIVAFWTYPPQPTVLYLRRFGDEAVGDRIREFNRKYVAPYVRLICLHEVKSNPDRADWEVLAAFVLPAVGFIILWSRLAYLFPDVDWPPGMPLILVGVSLFVCSWSGRKCYRKVISNSALSVFDGKTLAKMVERETSWLHSNRRMVFRRVIKVSVGLSMWKETVLRLAELSDAILIDVSSVGEGLTWEIEELLPKYEDHVVLFGKEKDSCLASGFPDTENSRLKRVLSRYEVIWERRGFWGSWRFRRQLRKALLEAANRGSKTIFQESPSSRPGPAQ